ncbi:hypothetical protein [Modestobacter sp. VKM Ac-2984]|uniref:hypothetical protein n=1 Tax=Modestobacter sp. VKM Ac-2984 TaxID=3004138 RepID=UPI0022AAAB89|nr:hypothetical protein [Modestobacter sp. VKM Ac-2984]MCZ2817265.1 hypothetical protein [Modestobacter sp. VKM Ac-2984]
MTDVTIGVDELVKQLRTPQKRLTKLRTELNEAELRLKPAIAAATATLSGSSTDRTRRVVELLEGAQKEARQAQRDVHKAIVAIGDYVLVISSAGTTSVDTDAPGSIPSTGSPVTREAETDDDDARAAELSTELAMTIAETLPHLGDAISEVLNALTGVDASPGLTFWMAVCHLALYYVAPRARLDKDAKEEVRKLRAEAGAHIEHWIGVYGEPQSGQ